MSVLVPTTMMSWNNLADWINCACGQWLLEECAEGHEVDANGRQILFILPRSSCLNNNWQLLQSVDALFLHVFSIAL